MEQIEPSKIPTIDRFVYQVRKANSIDKTPYVYQVLNEFKKNPRSLLTPSYFIRKLDIGKGAIHRVLNALEEEGRINIGSDVNHEPTYTLNTR